MKFTSRWLLLAACSTAWCVLATMAPAALAADRLEASADASQVIAWVHKSRDAHGKPFAVVDKRNARIHVFGADGKLVGSSVVLLGQTRGDNMVPGVGARAQTGTVGPGERTTPAGRFEAEPGENLKGEPIVWVDYESAFVIHRVRPGRSWKVRAQRLASADPDDKRVSWGCVVVPVAFYLDVVQKVLGKSPSVVYVLPEARPVQSLIPALAAS